MQMKVFHPLSRSRTNGGNPDAADVARIIV